MFSEKYPSITEWVDRYGWIEIGYDEMTSAFVRAHDMGGTIWMSEKPYDSVDEALQDLEIELKSWMDENYG